MSPLFSRLAVLGLGLLGGSVAAAARARGVAGTVVGSARRRAPLEAALQKGVVDAIASPEEAVKGADLVLLATPVSSMAAVLQTVAPHLAQGALVTDVGSVKGHLVDTLPGLLPPGVHFLGSHPMAGSHHRGVEHARADLLEGACCVVTPTPSVPDEACERLAAFWRALGARVTRRDPADHDEQVAWVSHLPHLLAFAYAKALEFAPATAGEIAGSGFRDFVRIARSDSELWGDILGVNRKALVRPLQAFRDALAELAQALEEGDTAAQERLLEDARGRLAALAPEGAEAQTPGRRDNDSKVPDPGA